MYLYIHTYVHTQSKNHLNLHCSCCACRRHQHHHHEQQKHHRFGCLFVIQSWLVGRVKIRTFGSSLVAHKPRHMPRSLLLPLQAESQFWAHLTRVSRVSRVRAFSPHQKEHKRITDFNFWKSDLSAQHATQLNGHFLSRKDREIHAGNCKTNQRVISSPSKCLCNV